MRQLKLDNTNRCVQLLISLMFPTAEVYLQEIADMLANNLTLDDEEAVQDELLALQQDIVRVMLYVQHRRSQSF